MEPVAVVMLTTLELFDFGGGRGFHVVAVARWERRQPVICPDFVDDVVVDRTGVRLLVGHSQFGQQLEYALGLHLQLSSQLVNSNLHRTALSSASLSSLRYFTPAATHVRLTTGAIAFFR
jgi:hypothetical protein